MGEITINQIISFIVGLSTLIGSVTAICMFCKRAINKAFKPVYKRIDKMDFNQSKNYLTEFLADVKNGIEKDENQIARATEVYDYYTNKLNGNSYIHTGWEKYMK